MRHVDPNLVGAARVQGALNQAALVVLVQHLDGRRGRFARLVRQVHHRHAQTVGRVTANRLLHGRGRRRRPGFVGDGQVLTLHVTGCNQLHQRVHGLACTGHHHQATGVFVQAVNNARPGHVRGQRVQRQQAVEQGAAPIAGRGVHHQTRRFVDHPQMRVFVDHVDGHGFRYESLRLGRGAQGHLNLVPQAHLGRHLGHDTAINQGIALLNQLLQIAARELGHHLSQRFVQALPVQIHGHLACPNLLVRRLVQALKLALVHQGGGVMHFGVGRYNQSVQQFKGVTDAKLQIIGGSHWPGFGIGTAPFGLRQHHQRCDRWLDT